MIEGWLKDLQLDNETINEYIRLVIIGLVRLLGMSQNTCQYQDKFYNQTEGTSMGKLFIML